MRTIRVYKKYLIVFGIVLLSITTCRNQFSSYDEIQFGTIGFCKGLDDNRRPVELSESVRQSADQIYFCFDVETDHRFGFQLDWYRGDVFTWQAVQVEDSGWYAVILEEQEGTLLVGEHTFVIWILKTLKVSKTLYVTE